MAIGSRDALEAVAREGAAGLAAEQVRQQQHQAATQQVYDQLAGHQVPWFNNQAANELMMSRAQGPGEMAQSMLAASAADQAALQAGRQADLDSYLQFAANVQPTGRDLAALQGGGGGGAYSFSGAGGGGGGGGFSFEDSLLGPALGGLDKWQAEALLTGLGRTAQEREFRDLLGQAEEQGMLARPATQTVMVGPHPFQVPAGWEGTPQEYADFERQIRELELEQTDLAQLLADPVASGLSLRYLGDNRFAGDPGYGLTDLAAMPGAPQRGEGQRARGRFEMADDYERRLDAAHQAALQEWAAENLGWTERIGQIPGAVMTGVENVEIPGLGMVNAPVFEVPTRAGTIGGRDIYNPELLALLEQQQALEGRTEEAMAAREAAGQREAELMQAAGFLGDLDPETGAFLADIGATAGFTRQLAPELGVHPAMAAGWFPTTAADVLAGERQFADLQGLASQQYLDQWNLEQDLRQAQEEGWLQDMESMLSEESALPMPTGMLADISTSTGLRPEIATGLMQSPWWTEFVEPHAAGVATMGDLFETGLWPEGMEEAFQELPVMEQNALLRLMEERYGPILQTE